MSPTWTRRPSHRITGAGARGFLWNRSSNPLGTISVHIGSYPGRPAKSSFVQRSTVVAMPCAIQWRMMPLRNQVLGKAVIPCSHQMSGKLFYSLEIRMPPRLTHEIITAAILGFEEQKRQIDTKIAEIRAI